jgi:hypothetical protein
LTFASISDNPRLIGTGGKMRSFNALAAMSAVLLAGGGVSAKEQPDQPKPRKICRNQEMPGRITPRRICRIVSPADPAAEEQQRKAGDPRGAGKSQD